MPDDAGNTSQERREQAKRPGNLIPLGFWRPVNPDVPDQPPIDKQFDEQFAEFVEFLQQRVREVESGVDRDPERLVMTGDRIDPAAGRQFRSGYVVPLTEAEPLDLGEDE